MKSFEAVATVLCRFYCFSLIQRKNDTQWTSSIRLIYIWKNSRLRSCWSHTQTLYLFIGLLVDRTASAMDAVHILKHLDQELEQLTHLSTIVSRKLREVHFLDSLSSCLTACFTVTAWKEATVGIPGWAGFLFVVRGMYLLKHVLIFKVKFIFPVSDLNFYLGIVAICNACIPVPMCSHRGYGKTKRNCLLIQF